MKKMKEENLKAKDANGQVYSHSKSPYKLRHGEATQVNVF